MLPQLIVAALLLCRCAAVASGPRDLWLEEEEEEWRAWKTQHSRAYEGMEEEGARRSIWQENRRTVAEHNARNLSFKLALNQFADMTKGEWRSLYLSPQFNASQLLQGSDTHRPLMRGVELPTSIDWRDYGCVSSVKDQGQCGSCWAFSAAGALETQSCRNTGKLVSLSEQQMVDCSWAYGNAGCNGGLMNYAFQYAKKKGICSENDYPYLEKVSTCRASYCSKVVYCSGYSNIKSGSEDSLMDAVANKGSVSVAVDASSTSFQFYSSGVYTDYTSCSSSNLNHGVLVVGYSTGSDGQLSWLVKNSWGSSWGNKGYILMAIGQNICGIASAASYPSV